MSTNLQCTVIYSLLHIKHRDFKVFVAFFICLNANCTKQWLNTREEGTIKTPIPKCHLYCCFFWGGVKVLWVSKSGQKQSLKTPAEYGRQHNSTPPPHPPPLHSHTLSAYTVHLLWEGGRGGGCQREGRRATVHKRGRKYQHDWLYLQAINSIKHQ
jgi:hypothetical protein